MFAKIEPTGCVVRNGMVQIRFSFYLEPGDYGYDQWIVDIPGKDGKPIGKRVNFFHTHFVYVEPDTPDSEIQDLAQAYLEEAYIKWACGETIDCKNYGKTREWNDIELAENLTVEKMAEIEPRIDACYSRLEQVTNITTEIRVT